MGLIIGTSLPVLKHLKQQSGTLTDIISIFEKRAEKVDVSLLILKLDQYHFYVCECIPVQVTAFLPDLD